MKFQSKAAIIVGAVLIFGAQPGAAADTTKSFYWAGVFGFTDCVYHCDYNDPISGCLTDPDCKCTCFQ